MAHKGRYTVVDQFYSSIDTHCSANATFYVCCSRCSPEIGRCCECTVLGCGMCQIDHFRMLCYLTVIQWYFTMLLLWMRGSWKLKVKLTRLDSNCSESFTTQFRTRFIHSQNECTQKYPARACVCVCSFSYHAVMRAFLRGHSDQST